MAEPRLSEGRFRAGRVLGGRYEIRSTLGHGGMAEVYQGWDRLLRRDVAIKVLWEGLARDRRFLVRFRREAHAVAALSHASIVSVFDAGSDAGTPFIVMEMLDGPTLADEIWERGPLPPFEVAHIGGAVAAALSHAHRAGIVHRDVKPANIMLTGDGVKVLDFGIAHAVAWTPVTVPWSLHGTSEYISPEQIRGEAVDGRSDVYSLGVVLFEALTGAAPFSGESALAVAYQHLEQAPPRPSAIVPNVPASLDAIVAKCLAKPPALRYQRADHLRADLERVRKPGARLEPAAVGAPDTDEMDPAWVGRAARRPARWRVIAVALAVMGVAAATVAGALAWPFGRAAEVPRRVGPSSRAPVAPPPLLAPTALRATDACDGFFSARIELTWTPSTTLAADGYEVYRSRTQGGPYQMIGLVLGRTKKAYVDRDLEVGTEYYYLVKATGEGRRSVGSANGLARTNGFCI